MSNNYRMAQTTKWLPANYKKECDVEHVKVYGLIS